MASCRATGPHAHPMLGDGLWDPPLPETIRAAARAKRYRIGPEDFAGLLDRPIEVLDEATLRARLAEELCPKCHRPYKTLDASGRRIVLTHYPELCGQQAPARPDLHVVRAPRRTGRA